MPAINVIWLAACLYGTTSSAKQLLILSQPVWNSLLIHLITITRIQDFFIVFLFMVKPDNMQHSTHKCLNIYYPSILWCPVSDRTYKMQAVISSNSISAPRWSAARYSGVRACVLLRMYASLAFNGNHFSSHSRSRFFIITVRIKFKVRTCLTRMCVLVICDRYSIIATEREEFPAWAVEVASSHLLFTSLSRLL